MTPESTAARAAEKQSRTPGPHPLPSRQLTPADLQRLIASSPMSTHRVLSWLSSRGIEHSGRISGATLSAVCGVDGRTWRKWVGAERPMPAAAWRLLVEVSGVDVGGQTEAA